MDGTGLQMAVQKLPRLLTLSKSCLLRGASRHLWATGLQSTVFTGVGERIDFAILTESELRVPGTRIFTQHYYKEHCEEVTGVTKFCSHVTKVNHFLLLLTHKCWNMKVYLTATECASYERGGRSTGYCCLLPWHQKREERFGWHEPSCKQNYHRNQLYRIRTKNCLLLLVHKNTLSCNDTWVAKVNAFRKTEFTLFPNSLCQNLK